MKNLTEGPIGRHLLSMSLFIGTAVFFQSAYYLVDLYFVSAIGPSAIAGVGAAGNAAFLILALSQLVSVGVTSLVARTLGQKNQPESQRIFNQSLGLSLFAAAVTLVAGYAAAGPAIAAITADLPSREAGSAYLWYFLPSLAITFPLVALSSTLRGAGVVQPAMVVQIGSVLLNTLLAPILIAGWLTHRPLGPAGAGLASSIATLAAFVALAFIFPRALPEFHLVPRQLRPSLKTWGQIVGIGAPVAGEFSMMFVVTTAVYWVIRHFGADAQAGFGIGSRIMTSIFLPAMAVAFAVTPIAGQNMGAGRHDRVRETFFKGAALSCSIMLVLTLICRLSPEPLIHIFTTTPAVVAVAATYLRIASWNFVAVGLIFVCSALFQAMGNTIPSFVSSASRILTYVLPAILFAGQMSLRHLWFLSMASITVQALFSLYLLKREAARRLSPALPNAIQAA